MKKGHSGFSEECPDHFMELVLFDQSFSLITTSPSNQAPILHIVSLDVAPSILYALSLLMK